MNHSLKWKKNKIKDCSYLFKITSILGFSSSKQEHKFDKFDNMKIKADT